MSDGVENLKEHAARVLSEFGEYLSERGLQELNELQGKLERADFYLAVVGHYKRGKSSLIKCFTGKRHSPDSCGTIDRLANFSLFWV